MLIQPNTPHAYVSLRNYPKFPVEDDYSIARPFKVTVFVPNPDGSEFESYHFFRTLSEAVGFANNEENRYHASDTWIDFLGCKVRVDE